MGVVQPRPSTLQHFHISHGVIIPVHIVPLPSEVCTSQAYRRALHWLRVSVSTSVCSGGKVTLQVRIVI